MCPPLKWVTGTGVTNVTFVTNVTVVTNVTNVKHLSLYRLSHSRKEPM